MGLPRVTLTEIDQLYPMFETDPGSGVPNSDYDTQVKKDTENGIHIGLVVYHISNESPPECAKIPTGLYVWEKTG